MKQFYILILSLLLLNGCSSRYDYFTSNITLQDKHKTVNLSVVADDMYNYIYKKYNPAQVTIYLYTSGFDKQFIDYLSDRLREGGFGVTSDNSVKELFYVSYNIINNDDSIMAIWNIGSSKITRIYKVVDGQLIQTGETVGFNLQGS